MTDKIKVLLVEDDKVDQTAFERLVQKEKLPYRYSIAGSIAEAEKVLQSDVFDIIVSDYLLQDGTTFDVLALKAPCPLVVTTGSGDEETAVRVMKKGAYDYLIKDPEGNYLKALPITIEKALKHFRNEKELFGYQQRLEFLVEERTRSLHDEIKDRVAAEEALKLDEERLESLLDLSHKRSASNKELIYYALEQAVRLTQSQVGFFYLYDFLPEENVSCFWSSEVPKLCRLDLPPHASLDQAGVWADGIRLKKPVIYNDYSTLKNRKGLPEGHFCLDRYMTVPIIVNDRLVGVVSVGNKKTLYDQADIRQLSLFMNSLWEIIQNKQSEQELRNSEERARLAFDHAPIGMFLANSDAVVTKVNSVLADMFGYDEKELVGKRTEELMHEDDLEDSQSYIEKVLVGEVDGRTAVKRYYHRDGNVIWVRISTSLVRSSDGDPLYFVGQMQNITEQKIAEEERRKLEVQLRQVQKMEAIGTLAGGIAHDFNNILVPIISFTEMVQESQLAGSQSYLDLQEVLTASKRAKDLVRQILDFSRQTETEHKPLKIIAVIKECLRLLSSSLPKNIEIKSKLNVRDDTIMGDPTQVQQVVLNLCTNSAHSMKENGGTLEVTLNEVSLDRNHPEAPDLAFGPYLLLSVRDSGSGMDEATLSRIFDPYYTTKSVAEGTGLGLSVVHGIVTQCGGGITVESELGHGSTFNVYLPSVQAVTEDIEAFSEPVPAGRGNILLVDDEEINTRSLTRLLRSLGYSVSGQTSSLEALKEFRRNPGAFDLVITDQSMPQMSGTQLTEKLKEIRPDVPIVLLTGFSGLVSEEDAQKSGIRKLLFKPVLKNQLGKSLQDILNPAETQKESLFKE
jgi:PAS domain S-box-containing protein